ncbi:MAG: hypothetical protein JNK89_08135 [Saprospiraceae bacterium]|nr:hypothetical protein [Saprospiraceae bacterium]
MYLHPTLRYFGATVMLALSSPAWAQQELLLHQQGAAGLWNATAVNPAFFPKEKRLAIGLPAFGLDAAHSGNITYNDLLREQGGRTVLDLGPAIDKLEPENDAYYDQRFETFSLGLRLPGNWWLQAGHAVRLNAALNYPKALAELFWNGNAPYIGQTLEVGFATTTFDWNELSLGLGKQFGERFTVGARVKYLSGISALQTDDGHRQVQVYTDPDIYQLTVGTDYAFHSSSLISAIDTAGLGFDLALNQLKNGFSENAGWAFDLGVQAQLGERLTLSASVLDLGGKISWKKNANYFKSQGSFRYDGVFIPGSDIINGTTDSLDFTAALDTLNDALQFEKTAAEFSSALPARIYVGASYRLGERWLLGAVLHHHNADRRKATSVGVNAQWSVLKWLTAGAMYSVNDQSAVNIGLSLVLKPGPVQLFILSDNALNAVTPYGSAAVNFRFGGALLF